MYILMLSRGVPSPANPQWGCFEKDQAEALASIGHKVVVMCIDRRMLPLRRRIGLVHHHLNGIHYYNSFWVPEKVTNLFRKSFSQKISDLQVRKVYQRILQQHGRPDVILGEFCYCTANGVTLSQREHLPLVGIEHLGFFNNSTLPPRIRRFAEYAYAHTHQIISVSENLRQGLLRHLHKNSVVINNCVSPEFTQAACAQCPSDRTTFVACGRLDYLKGYDLLIQAFAELPLKNENWQLLIIGEGELHKDLEQSILDHHLEQHIHLLGQKTRSEIVSIYQQSHAFLMPSRLENFSVAILEALALGLPTISSDCGSAKQCIPPSSGIIFPTNDLSGLKQAILTYWEHRFNYDNAAISHNCLAHYAPAVIAQQIATVLEQTIHDFQHE